MVSLTASSSKINQTRFEELWSENESAIRRYVWSLRPDPCGVEDILQETAIALWRKFDAYDAARPFAAWGCRFAFLQHLKHRQKCMRDPHLVDDERLKMIPADWDRESDVSVARRQALHESLTLLDESERQLLRCRYGSNETIQSMAKRRTTSVHKLYHALDSVRETLKITVNQLMIDEGWERSELA